MINASVIDMHNTNLKMSLFTIWRIEGALTKAADLKSKFQKGEPQDNQVFVHIKECQYQMNNVSCLYAQSCAKSSASYLVENLELNFLFKNYPAIPVFEVFWAWENEL